MIKGAGNLVFLLRWPLKALSTASSAGTAMLMIVMGYFALFSFPSAAAVVWLFALCLLSVCDTIPIYWALTLDVL